jgi:hypothetical protein
MTTTPVSSRVGSVRNNEPGLVEPDPEPLDPDVVRV